MQTVNVMLNTLCVPCECRCRYCLLSYSGSAPGAPWERSCAFARRFMAELNEARPDLPCTFSFGCSMEHPDLLGALRELCALGSPETEFLQCGGMRMRTEAECLELAGALKAEGVKKLNFTFYGLPDHHDRFASREGDFALLIRMLRAAEKAGLSPSCGVPLTKESAPQAERLLRTLTEAAPSASVRFFIPHEEGRGFLLAPIRLSEEELDLLPPEVRERFNRSFFRPEREWVKDPAFGEETRRTLLISLRNDNIERYEGMTAEEIIAEAEALDEGYYAAFPSFSELARIYGDPEGGLLYSRRDLFHHYRRLYSKEHGVAVYDVTDERQTGSRRS